MSEQPGTVFSVDDQRAMYVTFQEIDAYHGLAEAFGQTPTVAGPPLDLTLLDRLRETLAAAAAQAQPSDGHRLTPDEAEYLDLLRMQSTLRASLPLRLHRTCTACGTKKIINPARPKASTTEKAGDVANAIVGLANLAADPLGGFLDIMKSMGAKQSAGAVLCDYCEGFEFEHPAVTFCPACKALRTESVLVTCPDCGTDFAIAEARRAWVPFAEARDAARRADVHRAVAAACDRLAAGVYPEQRAALLATVDLGDEPRFLFRSSRPGDSTRSTVLLATTRQLVFVRETMAGKASTDQIAWAEVTGVRHFMLARAGRDATVQLERAGKDPLIFTRVGEVGQDIANSTTLDPAGVARELARLAGVALQTGPPPAPADAQQRVAASVRAQTAPTAAPPAAPMQVPAAQAPPAPAQVPGPASGPGTAPPAQATAGAAAATATAATAGPPRPPSEQPGWYPDPWRQSRIRWWDGNAWTSHVRA